MNENSNARLLVAYLPILVLTGCVSIVHVQRYTDARLIPTHTVEVVTAGPLKRSFVEIGEISVDGRKHKPVDAFVDHAKALGADAIVLMGERNRRVISHVIGERIVSRTWWDVWAVAIKYKAGLASLEERTEDWNRLMKRRVGLEAVAAFMPKPKSKPAVVPVPVPVKKDVPVKPQEVDVVKQLTKPVVEPQVLQVEESVPVPPVKAPGAAPVDRVALEPQAAQPSFDYPDEGVLRPHYAVMKLQKIYTAENWSALTNFTVIIGTPSLKECMEVLGESGEKPMSAECVRENGQYEKMFKKQAIGDWYVTVDLRNAYPWVARVDFGALSSKAGKPLGWNDDRKLEVSAALAAGAAFQAELNEADASVHIYSPKGEVAL